ncbi:transposase [Kitasatospora griseola]|uniref:transposase n=1 Tax=Kitasatospora griseola TaxID=2064 RepID=UPI003F4D9EF8
MTPGPPPSPDKVIDEPCQPDQPARCGKGRRAERDARARLAGRPRRAAGEPLPPTTGRLRCATRSPAASPGGLCLRTSPHGTASARLSALAGQGPGRRIPRPAAGPGPRVRRAGSGADRGHHRRPIGEGGGVAAGRESGFDGGKKVYGRKRHIVVDTLGLVLAVPVTATCVTDREAGGTLLERLRQRHWRITLVWPTAAAPDAWSTSPATSCGSH